MRIIHCEQGSGEWLRARCGLITASRMADVLSLTKKGEESQKRKDYRIEVVSERLSGQAVEKYVTFAMKEGTRLEPEARTEYELAADVLCDRFGFVLHPVLDFAGASPDGLVGNDGGLEIKCPAMTTHIEWMLAGVVPPEYEPQMAWNMACCEREWWDFMSYCPAFPEPLNRFIVRLYRDDKRIAEIADQVIRFNDSIEALVRQLRGENNVRERAA